MPLAQDTVTWLCASGTTSSVHLLSENWVRVAAAAERAADEPAFGS